MPYIIFGAIVLAAGVMLIAVPAGLIVLGLELVAAGVYREWPDPAAADEATQ